VKAQAKAVNTGSTSSTVSDAIVIIHNQYKVTSPVMNETYTSHWLYHVQLNDLNYEIMILNINILFKL
jgi:hypothetical protein